MSRWLVDTDVFVDHLRGHARLAAEEVHYSSITRAELFAGRSSQEEAVRTLLAPFKEHTLGPEVAEVGGAIRRRTGLALPDALIAATALLGGLPLMTRNRSHFDRVPELQVHGPPGPG